MRVDSNSPVPDPVNIAAAKPKAPTTEPEKSTIDLAASNHLTEALEKTPTMRADKIAQAKALIADPNYPNEATLRRVASILTDHIRPE